ncbi:MAG: MFS transporter [Candidatus Nanopelagicales bacterium]
MTTDGGRAAAPERHAVLRDRSTWITYVQVGLFGYFLYSFGPTIALLRDETGTTRAVAALHGTAMAVGSVVVGLAAPFVVKAIGRGHMMRAGSVLVAIGLAIYVTGGALGLTLLGILVAAAGGTACLVGANAFMPDHQGGPATPQAMSEMHAFGAVMGLLGPLAVGLAVGLTWGWRPAVIAGGVAFLVLEVVRGRRVHDFDGRYGDEGDEHPPIERLSRTFWIALVVFTCSAGLEFSLTFWGSDLVRERAGLGEAAAAAAIATIVGGLAIGRVVGSQVVARFDPETVLSNSFALSVVGFAIAWISTNPAVMLTGLLVTGLGMGLQSPLGIGRAVRAAGAQVDRAAGLTSVAAGAASGVAPFALGALADAVGVHTAFLIVPVLGVVGAVLVRLVRVDFEHETA